MDRDPRVDPIEGDIVEKVGVRYLPVRRIVTGRDGMYVTYRAEGKDSSISIWRSTWIDWCSDCRTIITAQTRHPNRNNQSRVFMELKFGAYIVKRDAHCWHLTETRPSTNEKALKKNPDATSDRTTYHSNMGEILRVITDREMALGEDVTDLAALKAHVDSAVERSRNIVEKLCATAEELRQIKEKALADRKRPRRKRKRKQETKKTASD